MEQKLVPLYIGRLTCFRWSVGGLLGSGGGFILGPLLLEIRVIPQALAELYVIDGQNEKAFKPICRYFCLQRNRCSESLPESFLLRLAVAISSQTTFVVSRFSFLQFSWYEIK